MDNAATLFFLPF